MLIPGESMAINFSVTVDNDTATKLNTGDEVLEDILILRLENGRDHYLTVSGKYARSCFGMSCTDLVLISVPVRDVPLATKERVEFEKVHLPAALSVPKELWRVVDAIYDKGLHEKDLFLTPGFGNELKQVSGASATSPAAGGVRGVSPRQPGVLPAPLAKLCRAAGPTPSIPPPPPPSAQIRECLDTSSDFGGFHVHSMAEAFVTLLSNLSTPIVPSTLFPTLEIDQQNIQPWSRRFLEELPPIHYNVFVYVISFFREVLLFGQSNHLTAQKLARVCCNCLTNQAEAEKEKVGGKAQRSSTFNTSP
jgi:phosphatidylinositol-bisphosphatase